MTGCQANIQYNYVRLGSFTGQYDLFKFTAYTAGYKFLLNRDDLANTFPVTGAL